MTLPSVILAQYLRAIKPNLKETNKNQINTHTPKETQTTQLPGLQSFFTATIKRSLQPLLVLDHYNPTSNIVKKQERQIFGKE